MGLWGFIQLGEINYLGSKKIKSILYLLVK